MKLLEFLKKNDWDEMQEQKMLKIAHNACLIAFWGLFILAMGQMAVSFGDIRFAAGELVLMLILCAYVVIACLRAGIWSRRIKPTLKSNLIGSLVGGLFVCVFLSVIIGIWSHRPLVALTFGGVFGAVTFALCMLCLQLSLRKYRKRLAELEAQADMVEENEL